MVIYEKGYHVKKGNLLEGVHLLCKNDNLSPTTLYSVSQPVLTLFLSVQPEDSWKCMLSSNQRFYKVETERFSHIKLIPIY